MARIQTTIRLPEELMERLQREADRMGVPMASIVMFALNWYFANHR